MAIHHKMPPSKGPEWDQFAILVRRGRRGPACCAVEGDFSDED